MIELEKRIKLLESRMALRQKEKKRHEPFMVLAPWSIAKDETIIKYYPEGLYQSPKVIEYLTLREAVDLADEEFKKKLYVQVSMGMCIEWMHVFTQTGKLYTQEQKERFRNRDMEQHPEIAWLYQTDEGREMAKVLARLPQTWSFCGI